MTQARLIASTALTLVALGIGGCFSSCPEDIQVFLKPPEVEVTADRYVLHPPDVIEVHCARVPEIDKEAQRIRPDGKVSFEELGEIEAAGKTVGEVADALRARVLELYNLEGQHPIDVRVVTYRSKVFYVLGQVLKPGPQDYTGRDTLLTALADAKPTPLAWEERVQVIRPSADKNAKPRIFELDYNRMVAHGDTSKNVFLQEGDIVYVPPTIFAAAAMKVEEVIRPIARAFAGVYIMDQGPTGRGAYYYGRY